MRMIEKGKFGANVWPTVSLPVTSRERSMYLFLNLVDLKPIKISIVEDANVREIAKYD